MLPRSNKEAAMDLLEKKLIVLKNENEEEEVVEEEGNLLEGVERRLTFM